ncbi:MAG TPA: arginyltransferase [Thermodesulfovibrionales bacterium]|nr:arginyltransferase [Thermodesulfovibrionales bacterium]
MKGRSNHLSLSFQEEVQCSYFRDGRTATLDYVVASEEEAGRFHSYLSRGYRRLGNLFYRNACADCSACIPLRIETARFEASKSQRRALRRNSDIRLGIPHQTMLTTRKVELYRKYVRSKHGNREQGGENYHTVLSLIHYGYADTIEMDYYLGDKLIGVGIVDGGTDSLSSNYFYYDIDHLDRRLGVFSILSEISLAKVTGKRYYYLGFCIEENPKMSYKRDFRPNEILVKGAWREYLT